MNFHPGTYPVPQMSQQQQLAYGSPASGQRTPLQMPPQQSPAQNQFYPPGFMPNNRPPMPQHQMQALPDQAFQLNQPFQQLQQASPSFYSQGGNAGNGQNPVSMPHVPSVQGFVPDLQNRVGNSGHPGAHHFQSADPTKMNMSQLPQNMAAPNPLPSATPTPQRSPFPNGGLGQQPQLQDRPQPGPKAVPQSSPHPSPSPQSIVRDRARVSVLLEINAYLLKEIFSLQAQGKAGGASQPLPSPTQAGPTGSPAAATDPNSLATSPKAGENKPASPEYNDCMRRLQANLAFLASQTKADTEKRPPGSVPSGPAILTAPPHLAEVHDLYKKLNGLFPGAQRTAGTKMPPGPVGANQIVG